MSKVAQHSRIAKGSLITRLFRWISEPLCRAFARIGVRVASKAQIMKVRRTKMKVKTKVKAGGGGGNPCGH